MWDDLRALHQQGLITDLDLHFTRLLARQTQDETPEFTLAACLASHWTGNGHVCVNLHMLAEAPLFDSDAAATPIIAPAVKSWIAALRRNAAVGGPGEFKPLILDERGRLYLYRYWDYERRLGQDLRARARRAPEDLDLATLRDGLARLFPARHADDVDWQKVAAAAAVLKRLCVISGGPGTGKTTTVVKILALLCAQPSARPLRIGLAAPTGKAAARLQEAIRTAKQQLGLATGLAAAIPEQASTLHRLLGARSGSVTFRHDSQNPLALDVLVVDEASMVDLALMTKLTDALPPQARLILLGDKDQLASVEAGAVLGDICGGAPGFSDRFQATVRALTGCALPPGAAEAAPLADSIALLRQSYRFGADSGIGALARAINQGQGREVMELLRNHAYADLLWRESEQPQTLAAAVADGAAENYREYLAGVRAGAGVEAIFSAFNRFRVLCALRHGPLGVTTLNEAIEQRLQARRWISARAPWYAGRPVMITRNDYVLRLYNGDIGIALHDPTHNGELRVFFQTAEGGARSLPPSRLPEHETVYAMTVHKSQGSEFERVALALPATGGRGVTRELLYTGVTRARVAVEIWGEAALLANAALRSAQRSSGLRDTLWD
ncbi:MAG: exodeoxyribonuclease V subunit alpha [Gammaproteobacteria bacterium]